MKEYHCLVCKKTWQEEDGESRSIFFDGVCVDCASKKNTFISHSPTSSATTISSYNLSESNTFPPPNQKTEIGEDEMTDRETLARIICSLSDSKRECNYCHNHKGCPEQWKDVAEKVDKIIAFYNNAGHLHQTEPSADRLQSVAEIYCQHCRQPECYDNCNCETCYEVAREILNLFGQGA